MHDASEHCVCCGENPPVGHKCACERLLVNGYPECDECAERIEEDELDSALEREIEEQYR